MLIPAIERYDGMSKSKSTPQNAVNHVASTSDTLRRDDNAAPVYADATIAALRRAARRGSAKLTPEMVAEIDRDWVVFERRQIAIRPGKAVRF